PRDPRVPSTALFRSQGATGREGPGREASLRRYQPDQVRRVCLNRRAGTPASGRIVARSDSRVCFGWALTRERRCPCPPPERFESSVRGTAFPATLHATRSLRRLVAGASLRAWGTRCRVRW